VPMMSFKGQGQDLALPLEAGVQTAIEFSLRQNLTPGPRRLRVEVRVLEGVASWSGNWMSESEKGSARVAVSVFDADDQRMLTSGEAESWAERTSMDTSDFRVKRILGTAVHGAALEFLASDAARAALGTP